MRGEAKAGTQLITPLAFDAVPSKCTASPSAQCLIVPPVLADDVVSTGATTRLLLSLCLLPDSPLPPQAAMNVAPSVAAPPAASALRRVSRACANLCQWSAI